MAIKRKNKHKILCEYCSKPVNGCPCIHTRCVEDYVRKVLNRSIFVTIFDKVRYVLLLCFVLVLTVSMIAPVQGLEFDNIKEYNQESNTVIIRNSFLSLFPLGEVAKIKLLSSHPRYITADDYAFELEFTLTKDYDGAIDDIEFYPRESIKSPLGQKIDNPEYRLEYYDSDQSYIDYEYTYKEECGTYKNQSYYCEQVVDTTTPITKYGIWKELNSLGDLKAGKTVVRGYYPDLSNGQIIDFIPTFFNVRIQEWADFGSASMYEYHYGGANGGNLANGEWWCQTITVGVTGVNTTHTIIGVQVTLRENSAGNNYLYPSVWNLTAGGVPDTRLSNWTWDASNVTASNLPYNITFTNHTFEAGGKYGLCFDATGEVGNLKLRYNAADSYAGGQTYYSTDQGSSFTPYSGDLEFNVYGYNYSEPGDNTPPYFISIPANSSVSFGSGLGVDFSADDETEFDSYLINWTTTFSINSSGYLSNSTPVSAGTYNFNVSINDSSGNYNETEYNFTVSQGTGEAYLFLDGSRANLNAQNNTLTGYSTWSNATLNVGTGTVRLWVNGSMWNEGGSPQENNTELPIGFYTATAEYLGNTNYTADNETWNINITNSYIPDNNAPYFTIFSNQLVQLGNSLGYDIEAVDDEGNFESYTINWSGTFSINSTGYLSNTSTLSLGNYYINVFINDTSNNLNSSVLFVNVTNYTGTSPGGGSNYTNPTGFFYVDFTVRHNLYFMIIFFIVASALIFTKFRFISSFMFLIGGFIMMFSGIHFLIALVPFVASLIIGGSKS